MREFKWPAAIHGVAILTLLHGSVHTPYSCKSEYRSIKTSNTYSTKYSQTMEFNTFPQPEPRTLLLPLFLLLLWWTLLMMRLLLWMMALLLLLLLLLLTLKSLGKPRKWSCSSTGNHCSVSRGRWKKGRHHISSGGSSAGTRRWHFWWKI